MMAGGAPLNIKMSLAARWDRRPDILQLKAASSLSWTIMRGSAAGIRKSHSCLIRIQCPDLLIAILVFTFYFQKLHIPPVACNKKRVAKIPGLWLDEATEIPGSHSPEYIFDGLYSWQEADYDIALISLRALRVPSSFWVTEVVGTLVFRLTVPSLWISIRAQFSDQRWSPPTPIMIHNLHLEVNQICHGHKQTKYWGGLQSMIFWSGFDSNNDASPSVPMVQSVVKGVKTQLISVIASRAVDDAEPFCSNYSVCTFHGSPPSCLWLVSGCQPRPLIGCSDSPCAAPAR